MTTYDTVLSDADYLAISKKLGEYYQEIDKSIYFPLIDISNEDFNALKYRHVKLQKSTRSAGKADRFSPAGNKAQTGHLYDDFYLGAREVELEFPTKINTLEPPAVINQKREQEMRQFMKDIDEQNFYGCYEDPDGKVVLLDDGGYITQAATVADLNGTDSNLATKGYAWKGIKKMIETIPLRHRENLPNMIAMMTENLYNKLTAPDRIYEGAVTEFQKIVDSYMSPSTPKTTRIDKIIVTNNLLIDGTDTEGTNDRIALYIPDPTIVARVISLPPSPIGNQVPAKFSTNITYGYRGSLCVFDTSACLLSEQIVYA